MAEDTLYGWKAIGTAIAAVVSGVMVYFGKKAKSVGNGDDTRRLEKLESGLLSYGQEISEMAAKVHSIELAQDVMRRQVMRIASLREEDRMLLEESARKMDDAVDSLKRLISRVRRQQSADAIGDLPPVS